MLRFIYGYDLPETAKMMSLPLSTVKTKYYRALDKIKKLPGII
jgi:DNA-directed RNA polymerase specialized sigma24 family protein